MCLALVFGTGMTYDDQLGILHAYLSSGNGVIP